MSDFRQVPSGQSSQDRAVSSTFLALIAAFLLCAVLVVLQPAYARLLAFPFVLVGYVISLCLHEFGHAIVAYHCGDRTVRAKGYLTLNPLHYTDAVNSIVIPVLIMAIGGIGLPGGAVYINRQLLRRRVYGALVSAGGPLATAVVLGLLLAVLQAGSQALAAAPVLHMSLAFLALLELTALVFNLLPCPGLDGWGIIEPFLPDAVRTMGRRLSYIAPAILVIALFLVPPLNSIFWNTVFKTSLLVGLDARLAFQGFGIFQFWR